MIAVLRAIGRAQIKSLHLLGSWILFSGLVLWKGIQPPYYIKKLYKHFIEGFFYSLPLVALTALFTGMVLSLQSYMGFARFHAESATASVVVLSMTRELSPVLVGLMLAGRLGASVTAEISTMRVTEQIDALIVMSVHPIRYLIFPRLIAYFFALPLLVIIANIIGVLGGMLVAIGKLNFTTTSYITKVLEVLYMHDITLGLLKSCFFSVILTLISCYQGYNCRGGAKGVGNATTNAVVGSSIGILIVNYLLTHILFEGKC